VAKLIKLKILETICKSNWVHNAFSRRRI